MPTPRVICVGEMLWDRLLDHSDLSDSSPAIAGPRYPGGAVANVACALVRLGCPTAFVGALGKDDAGDRLLEVLSVNGVATLGVQRSPAPTREVWVARNAQGDRSFVGFGEAADEGKLARNLPRRESPRHESTDFADAQLRCERLPDILFTQAEYLVLGTLGLAAPVTGVAIETALDLADRNYLKIFLDVNWRPMFWPNPSLAKGRVRAAIERVDFLKLAREEAHWLLGTSDPEKIRREFDHLEAVIVTDGDQGCAYSFGEVVGQLPAFRVAAVDTTGAGDAFVAAFVAQLIEYGLPALANPTLARSMVGFAAAAGALAATQAGAITSLPTRSAVQQFVRDRSPF